MDFDPWRWVAIPTWGLVLLMVPVVGAIVAWMRFGFLPAVGVAAVLLIVLRFLFSNRLFYGWQFIAALRGRYVVEQMPVTAVRVRLVDDREVQVRVKGHVAGGALLEGDRIAVWGRWRSGVLHTRRISCERTGATMTPRQPDAFAVALVGIAVLTMTGLWLYVSGIPWAMDQIHSVRASVIERSQDISNFGKGDER